MEAIQQRNQQHVQVRERKHVHVQDVAIRIQLQLIKKEIIMEVQHVLKQRNVQGVEEQVEVL